MTAPTPPGVWIVRRETSGVLHCWPAEFRYARECEETWQWREQHPTWTQRIEWSIGGFLLSKQIEMIARLVATESEGGDAKPR